MIKVKDGVDLTKYGFKLITDTDDHNYVLDQKYAYQIGYSRRGQYYYYLVDKKGILKIYASEPDGSGGATELSNIIFRMYDDNCFEEVE